MIKPDFVPIVIVSNWKSGSTPLQFLLARDSKIYNFFPDEESNYDGTAFWVRHKVHILHRRFGNHIPEKYFSQVDRDKIIEELNEKFDNNCEYGLIKRPQFILSIPFIKWLFPNVKLLGIMREPIPTAYSYFRTNYTNNPDGNNIKIGLKPPGWIKFEDKPLMEYIAWAYIYSLKLLNKYEIPWVTYEDMCNKTNQTIKYLSELLSHDLKIIYENIPNLNYVYKTGCQSMSRNRDTEKGVLNIPKTDKREVPPFTQEQIDELFKYLDMYRDMEVDI